MAVLSPLRVSLLKVGIFVLSIVPQQQVLGTMVHSKPDLYLDECCDWFKEVTGNTISVKTMCIYLLRLGFTRRKVNNYIIF